MPCGQTNMPAPKLRTSLPVESKRCTGFTLVPRQPGVVPGPQRSTAHTDLPSLSTATPFEPPHGRVSLPNFAQSRITLYGLAPELTGGIGRFCAVPEGSAAWPPMTATATITTAANEPFAKADIRMALLRIL